MLGKVFMTEKKNSIVWSHFKANCMWMSQMAPANVFVSLTQKLYTNIYI